jgi:hypothetical protein
MFLVLRFVGLVVITYGTKITNQLVSDWAADARMVSHDKDRMLLISRKHRTVVQRPLILQDAPLNVTIIVVNVEVENFRKKPHLGGLVG